MPDIVRPPTDNLYKFVALSGVLVVVLSVAYYEVTLQGFRDRILDVQDAKDVARLELDEWAGSTQELRGLADEMEEATRAEEIAELSEAIDRAITTSALQDSVVHQAMLEWKAQARRMQFLNDDTTRATIVATVGLLLGLLLMANGFTLWYDRVQRYEDLRLKAAVKDLGEPPGSTSAGDKAGSEIAD